MLQAKEMPLLMRCNVQNVHISPITYLTGCTPGGLCAVEGDVRLNDRPIRIEDRPGDPEHVRAKAPARLIRRAARFNPDQLVHIVGAVPDGGHVEIVRRACVGEFHVGARDILPIREALLQRL
jgi:hypothetical protein